MKLFNHMLLVGALAGAGTVTLPAVPVVAQEAASNKAAMDELGQLLKTLELQTDRKETRFDFSFKAAMQDQEWGLSMSTALSTDGSTLWIIAWLDPLPTSQNDVPRAALLRLLAQNDQLGDGKFFAYIPHSRRFVMQKSVSYEGMTSARLRILMQELGSSVIETHPIWSTANWNANGVPGAPAPAPTANSTTGTPVQSVVNESKFEQPVRR